MEGVGGRVRSTERLPVHPRPRASGPGLPAPRRRLETRAHGRVTSIGVPTGAGEGGGAVVDLLLGTAAGVASGHLRTDLPKEPPRNAELREPKLQQHVARDPSAASGNPSAFIFSAPEPAPPLTNPFLQPGPGRWLQVSKGPGCGRGVCGGRAPVALATLPRQYRPPPPTDPVEN